MSKKSSTILWFGLAAVAFFVQIDYAKGGVNNTVPKKLTTDSAGARTTVISIIKKVVEASSTFDIDAVADLYTPNAVVADEEPPFSWNGPTAGVQWVNTVEKTCKDVKLKGFKGKIGHISVYLQTDESVYVVVPVDYTGQIKGDPFEEDGAFTFVFRMVSGRWLIKSQVWVARRSL
ncbi:MAG: YybH family protein [Mucilaginibacter sp.]